MNDRSTLRSAALACVLALAACATLMQRQQRDALTALREQLVFQYHDCVPLGWAPIPVHGTYYPGYTATVSSYGMWLDAMWRGHVRKGDLAHVQAREVRLVLDRLVAAGLLDVHESPDAFEYSLRPAAFSSFYASSSYANNRDSLPYLCYDTIVPQRIVRFTPIASPTLRSSTNQQWYDVTFSWILSGAEAWSNDPILRSHSVVLSPLRSPVHARMYVNGPTWHLVRLWTDDWMLPALASAPAWKGS